MSGDRKFLVALATVGLVSFPCSSLVVDPLIKGASLPLGEAVGVGLRGHLGLVGGCHEGHYRCRTSLPFLMLAHGTKRYSSHTFHGIGGQRVVHIATHKFISTTLCEFVAAAVDITVEDARFLVELGAVYVARLATGLDKDLADGSNVQEKSPQDRKGIGAALASESTSSSSKEQTATTTIFRHVGLCRLETNLPNVPSNSYVRVHCNPRRFTAAGEINWKDRVVDINKYFVVVDKPWGTVSVPTLDNARENVLHQVSIALGLKEPLKAVNRLDMCTSGLLIFARTSEAAALLGNLWRENRVTKVYQILLGAGDPVPVGPIVHCCRKKKVDGPGGPRLYAPFDPELLQKGGPWQKARLHVLSCEPATGRALAVAAAYAKTTAARGKDTIAAPPMVKPQQISTQTLPSPAEATPQVCVVKLETGHTHQIRLQMSALGKELIGDSKYNPVVGRVHRGVPEDNRTDLFGPMPERIGLQAMYMRFEWQGKRVEYYARKPWWDTESDEVGRRANGGSQEEGRERANR